MHVALVTDTLETGGGLEQIFQTVNALQGIRFSLCARGGRARRRFLGLENAAVNADGFGRSRVLGLEPDLIHFHHLRPLLHFFAVPVPACRVPLVFTAHGLHGRKYDHRPGARSRAAGSLRALLEERLFRNVDRVIAVSAEDESRLRNRYRLRNVVRIPNGVDVRGLEQIPRCPGTFRKELGLPGDAAVFLTAARFDFQKGYDILLEAIRLGRDRFREHGVRFVLAGDGRERAAMKRLAEEGGLGELVRFAGERTDAGRMMKASDLFVLPSRWEGLPVSLLEAAFCRLPIVASDTCGNREVVRQGVNGLLFENGNPGSLCRVLVSMIDPGRRSALCSAAPAPVTCCMRLVSRMRILSDYGRPGPEKGKTDRRPCYCRPHPFHSRGVFMITDTEVKIKGVQALTESLGTVGAERFIALIQREPFDYTKWQRTLWEGLSVEEISRRATRISEHLAEHGGAGDLDPQDPVED